MSGVSRGRSALARIGAGLSALMLFALAVGAFVHSRRAAAFATFDRSVIATLAARVVHDEPTASRRINPGLLGETLATPAFAPEFRAAAGAAPLADDPLLTPFLSNALAGYEEFSGGWPLGVETARDRIAVLLAERARYELAVEKSLLKRGITLLLERAARAPTSALFDFEMALAADSLARLEDDRPGTQRQERARFLGEFATRRMARAVEQGGGSSTYRFPLISSAHANLVAGGFFTARAKIALKAGDQPLSAQHLEMATRAYRQAILHDPTPFVVNRALDELTDSKSEPEHRTAISWAQIAPIFVGASNIAQFSLIERLINAPDGAALAAAKLDLVIASEATTASEHGQALFLAVRAALASGDLAKAGERVRDLSATSSTRETDLPLCLIEYRARGQTRVFLELARELIEKHPDLRILLLVAAQAAIEVNAREEARALLERFCDNDGSSSATRGDLRTGRLLLAQLYANTGTFPAALSIYRSLWAEDNTDRTVGLGLATTMIAAGEKDAARTLTLQLLDRFGDDPEVRKLLEQMR